MHGVLQTLCSVVSNLHVYRFKISFSDEMHRVKLRFSPSGSNYINASYIHVRKLNSTAHTLFLHCLCVTSCPGLSMQYVFLYCEVFLPTIIHYILSCPGLPTEARVHSHSRSPGAHHWRLVEDGGGE